MNVHDTYVHVYVIDACDYVHDACMHIMLLCMCMCCVDSAFVCEDSFSHEVTLCFYFIFYVMVYLSLHVGLLRFLSVFVQMVRLYCLFKHSGFHFLMFDL